MVWFQVNVNTKAIDGHGGNLGWRGEMTKNVLTTMKVIDFKWQK